MKYYRLFIQTNVHYRGMTALHLVSASLGHYFRYTRCPLLAIISLNISQNQRYHPNAIRDIHHSYTSWWQKRLLITYQRWETNIKCPPLHCHIHISSILCTVCCYMVTADLICNHILSSNGTQCHFYLFFFEMKV